MKVKITILKLAPYQKFQAQDAHKLRGYFANQFQQYNLLHNHQVDGASIYRYPKVQYKVINNRATVVGINEGVEALEKVYFDLKELIINQTNYSIMEKSINQYQEDIYFTKTPLSYKFLSPWLALNEKNFIYYKNLTNWQEKKEFCDKILTGNILSFLKNINVWAEEEVIVQTKLQQLVVKFKNRNFLGFTGNFNTNIKLPSYIGLGKSPSRGFGTIWEEKNNGIGSY